MIGRLYEDVPFLLLSLALLALVLTGCPEPMTPEQRGIDVNRDIIKVTNQDKAMLLTEAMVEDAFGVPLDNVWETTTVWWADTTCQGQDPGTYGIQYKRSCVYGIMWSCDEIYVALSNLDPTRTCGSALLHEFGHCLSSHVWGHFSGNGAEHYGPIWAVIEAADDIACTRDW